MDVFRNGFPPGVSDAEMLMFNVFAFGNVYYITYKGERTVIAKGLGYFWSERNNPVYSGFCSSSWETTEP